MSDVITAVKGQAVTLSEDNVQDFNVDELFKTYTTRIGSRLAGSYRFLRFFGEDLRFKKSKKEK